METHHQVCFTNASSVHNVLQAISDCLGKKKELGEGSLERQKVGHFAFRWASLSHFHIVHLTFQSIFHPLRRTPNSSQDQHLAFLISDPASPPLCSGHAAVFLLFFFFSFASHPQKFSHLQLFLIIPMGNVTSEGDETVPQ